MNAVPQRALEEIELCKEDPAVLKDQHNQLQFTACRHRVGALQVGQRSGVYSTVGAHACSASRSFGGDRPVQSGSCCAKRSVWLP